MPMLGTHHPTALEQHNRSWPSDASQESISIGIGQWGLLPLSVFFASCNTTFLSFPVPRSETLLALRRSVPPFPFNNAREQRLPVKYPSFRCKATIGFPPHRVVRSLPEPHRPFPGTTTDVSVG